LAAGKLIAHVFVETVGTDIHKAFIASCTNGRYEDFVVAANFIRGKKSPKHVRLIMPDIRYQKSLLHYKIKNYQIQIGSKI